MTSSMLSHCLDARIVFTMPSRFIPFISCLFYFDSPDAWDTHLGIIYGHKQARGILLFTDAKINLSNGTAEATRLYLSLKRRGVPAELEKFDGYKTIDIAVADAKVNIEVDGHQHISNPKQALSDLKRTYFSLQKGFLTLRIPNALIREYLEETADYITTFLLENKNKIRNSFY